MLGLFAPTAESTVRCLYRTRVIRRGNCARVLWKDKVLVLGANSVRTAQLSSQLFSYLTQMLEQCCLNAQAQGKKQAENRTAKPKIKLTAQKYGTSIQIKEKNIREQSWPPGNEQTEPGKHPFIASWLCNVQIPGLWGVLTRLAGLIKSGKCAVYLCSSELSGTKRKGQIVSELRFWNFSVMPLVAFHQKWHFFHQNAA